MLQDKKVEIIDVEADEIAGESNVVSIALDRSYANSNLRDQYLKEKQAIEAEYGGLEEIRTKLGFSRRKMCQLLLVDPSAWTRWTKSKEGAPPHVYQSLKWYMELNKKDSTFRVEVPSEMDTEIVESKIAEATSQYNSQIQTLTQELSSIKNALTVKDDMMNALGDKLANTISRSLTQVQVQIQNPAPMQQQAALSVNMDAIRDTIKTEQMRSQSQINALENTLMMMRNELSNLRNQPAQVQYVQQPQAPRAQKSSYYDEDDVYQNTTNKFLVGIIVSAVLGGIIYAFLNYF